MSNCRNIYTQRYSNKKEKINNKKTNNKRIEARRRAFCLFAFFLCVINAKGKNQES